MHVKNSDTTMTSVLTDSFVKYKYTSCLYDIPHNNYKGRLIKVRYVKSD